MIRTRQTSKSDTHYLAKIILTQKNVNSILQFTKKRLIRKYHEDSLFYTIAAQNEEFYISECSLKNGRIGDIYVSD